MVAYDSVVIMLLANLSTWSYFEKLFLWHLVTHALRNYITN